MIAMIGSDSGVYLTFYNEDEPREKELPALGPFEMLVIRHNRIIGDREDVEHDEAAMGSVERWLEAELELRRAQGEEPGGIKRSHMRIRAPHGDILVRFYDYSGDQPPEVPELGPFYSVSIGKREVRADDKLLAIRTADIAPWTLTDAVRPGVAGVLKSDFSVFTQSARQGSVAAPPRELVPPAAAAPAPGASAPAAAPVAEAAAAAAADAGPMVFTERKAKTQEIYVSRPLAPPTGALTPADAELVQRVERLREAELTQALMVERMRRDQHVDPEAALRSEAVLASTQAMRFQPPVDERAEVEDGYYETIEPLSIGERLVSLAWSARFVVIGLLVIAAGVAAYAYVRAPAAPAGAVQLTVVPATTKVNTPDWTIAVDSIEHARTVGPTAPRLGGYLVVHLTIAKKNGDAPNLDTSDFALVDATGNQSLPFGAASDVYGPASGMTWPQRFPVGAAVRAQLIFDVSPSARDLLLLIRKASTEVRLPN
jgi:hypothetical protein